MKIALLGGLPKASGDLAPERTPEPGPAGERVSLHGWTLEVEFNDHPSIPSLARSMLSCSVPPSHSLAAAAAQNHILGFKDLASVARRGARRGGRRRLVSPCVGRDRGGQIVPRGRNPANEGGRVASVRVCPVGGGPAPRSLARSQVLPEIVLLPGYCGPSLVPSRIWKSPPVGCGRAGGQRGRLGV